MQQKSLAPLDADLQVFQQALQRRYKAKPSDPYKQVLHRKHYYMIARRLPLQRVTEAQLQKSADWEILPDGTVLIYSVNEWGILNWFSELAKTGDLSALTPAELFGLQEDYRAFQARVIPIITPGGVCWSRKSIPSLEELTCLQELLHKHIKNFLSTGTFTFTTFTPTRWIERDPEDPQRLISHEFVPDTTPNGLLYLFSILLGRLRLPIERCPYCGGLFLKPRKDAVHCSRKCQYLDYAQKQRGDRPPGKRGRPRKHHEPQQRQEQTATKKKGGSHGAKKRKR